MNCFDSKNTRIEGSLFILEQLALAAYNYDQDCIMRAKTHARVLLGMNVITEDEYNDFVCKADAIKQDHDLEVEIGGKIEDLITISEYAELVGRSSATIRQRILRGTLPAVKRYGIWLIRKDQPLTDGRMKDSTQA